MTSRHMFSFNVSCLFTLLCLSSCEDLLLAPYPNANNCVVNPKQCKDLEAQSGGRDIYQCNEQTEACERLTSSCRIAKDPECQGSRPHCDDVRLICVECLDNSHCMMNVNGPHCDADTGLCAGCQQDDECDSRWCDAQKCIDTKRIVYVQHNDPGACALDGDASGGTIARPFCDVSGVVRGNGMRQYVKILSPAGAMTSYVYKGVSANVGEDLVVRGEGRLPTTRGVQIKLAAVSGGMLTLSGVRITSADMDNPCASCTGGRLTVTDAVMSNSSGKAVEAKGSCAALNLQRNIIQDSEYGVFIAEGSAVAYYMASNTFRRIRTTGAHFGNPAYGYFGFNTVLVDSTGATNRITGIDCYSTAQSVAYSLAFDVTDMKKPTVTLISPNCGQVGNVTETVDMDLPTTEAPLLIDRARTRMNCIDKVSEAQAKANAGRELPPVFDLFGSPRPQGKGYDIGAHELK